MRQISPNSILGIPVALALLGLSVTPSGAADPAPMKDYVPVYLKDAEGRTLLRAPTGHLTNYGEDKMPAYTLPDPLVMQNGEPVRDADAWQNQRRPEILRLYEIEIFGRVPDPAPKVSFEVFRTDIHALGNTAIRRHVVIRFGRQPG